MRSTKFSEDYLLTGTLLGGYSHGWGDSINLIFTSSLKIALKYKKDSLL